jgi:outer membrane protein assembly factor BamB
VRQLAAAASLVLLSATIGAPASAGVVRVGGPAASVHASYVIPDGMSPDAQLRGWLQFGYDSGHSGSNPSDKAFTAKNLAKVQIAWNDQNIIQPSGIVVGGSLAYVDDMGQAGEGLYALDTATGAQKWHTPLGLNGSWGSFTRSVAALAGNVVVSPCSNGSSSKFLTGICGVNATGGKVLWTTYCMEYQGSPCGGLVNAGTSPAFYNGLIYLQMVEGINEQPDTEAINPKTGKRAWDVAGVFHCPDAGETTGSPLPAQNGRVFAVMGCQAPQGATAICALSASSGTAAWCDTSPTIYIHDLIAADGKLFLTEPGGSSVALVALDAASGAPVWSTLLPGANGSSIAAANGKVFVNEPGRGVFGLSATTGDMLWSNTSNLNLTMGGALSVANGLVYTDGFGGNNGDAAVTVLSAKSGKQVWSSSAFAGNGSTPATPIIVKGTIYAGCYTMCAFTLPSGLHGR